MMKWQIVRLIVVPAKCATRIVGHATSVTGFKYSTIFPIVTYK